MAISTKENHAVIVQEVQDVYIFRGNRDFRACEAFRAAATAKEYVKATGAV